MRRSAVRSGVCAAVSSSVVSGAGSTVGRAMTFAGASVCAAVSPSVCAAVSSSVVSGAGSTVGRSMTFAGAPIGASVRTAVMSRAGSTVCRAVFVALLLSHSEPLHS